MIPMASEVEVAGTFAADYSARVVIRVMLPDGITTFGLTAEEAEALGRLVTEASELGRELSIERQMKEWNARRG